MTKVFKDAWPFSAAFMGLCCICICMLFPANAFSDVYIIVNTSVERETLSKSDIKKLFLGERVKWNENLQVTPVTVAGSGVHEEFTKEYLSKTPSQFSAYWRTMIFSGKGIAPTTAKSMDEVIDYVAKTKGAIGYVSVKTQTANVKIIQVTGN